MLFVGSCFATEMGRRFADERFPVTVNPRGVMYNPASILHTVRALAGEAFDTAVLTLGTNHVYVERATGEIVDNCQKRPQRLFSEQQLTVEECADLLRQTFEQLRRGNPAVKIVLTVSPIRYRKYGFHGSNLSKATLLLAADRAIEVDRATRGVAHELAEGAKIGDFIDNSEVSMGGENGWREPYYFPAYELMNDELRDYRFYKADMLHPSEQAADYIFNRFVEACFSPAAKQYLAEWRPVKEALAHRPLHPESAEYRAFAKQTRAQLAALAQRYKGMVADER